MKYRSKLLYPCFIILVIIAGPVMALAPALAAEPLIIGILHSEAYP